MAWITITEEDVQSQLATAELSALQTVQLASGQDDPLPEIIDRVTREVRGYVAACGKNSLGAGQTIPDELHNAAIDIIRYRLATRLPVRSLVTEDRRKAFDDARAMLRDAAACRLEIVQPATASSENTSSAPVQIATQRPTRPTSTDTSGLF